MTKIAPDFNLVKLYVPLELAVPCMSHNPRLERYRNRLI